MTFCGLLSLIRKFIKSYGRIYFMAKESKSRIIINDMLRHSGWILEDQEKPNVITELSNESGSADYVMLDKNNYHLCILEAKKELINPLSAKKHKHLSKEHKQNAKTKFKILKYPDCV